MRNSNNAMTFLLAQYRAIFKRAYFKGLATAVLMTAGLAAGAAQANDQTGQFSGSEWASPVDRVDLKANDSVALTKDVFVKDLTATGESVTINTESNGSGGRLFVTNSFTLNNGTLTLSGSTNGRGIFGINVDPATVSTSEGAGGPLFDGTAITSFEATNSNITISGTQQAILFTNVTLSGSGTTVSIASGSGIGAEPGDKAENRTPDRGLLTLDGGTYNLDNTAWLYGNNVVVTEGTVLNVSSGAKAVSGSAPTTSDIYAKKTGTLDFAGTLNVAQSGAAMLGGGTVNLLDGANINNSGTLILGYEGTSQVNIKAGATINHVTSSDHVYAGTDIVMTGGTLNLDQSKNTNNAGWGLIGTKVANTASQDFVYDLTATGGTINVTKSQIQMQNVTLGGDVAVKIGTNIGDNSGSNYADNSQINAIGEGKAGVLTVTGNATLTMQAGSLLTANRFELTGGTIALQGDDGDDATASGSSGSAMIRGYGDGILNLAGTEISVASGNAGVLRAKDISLTASTLTNAGTLTIAGSVLNTAHGNTVVSGTVFEMTGGALTNTGTLNLGIGSGTESFTIAGGSFNNNQGTIEVKSGSTLALTGSTSLTTTITNSGTIEVQSGGKFTTAGTVTVGGTGKISLASGSSNTLGGENVVLNGVLDLASGATTSITGKVTFNGDGNSGASNLVDLKVADADDLTLATGGSLTIADVGQTIGLSHTAGESGGTFTKGEGFAGLTGSNGGTLYLDMVGVIKDADGNAITTMTQAEATQYADKLKSTLGLSSSSTLLNLQGITISLGQEVEDALASGDNTIGYDQVKDSLGSGLENDILTNTAVQVTADDQIEGSIGQVQAEAGTATVNVAGNTLKLNGYVSNSGATSNVLAQTGSDAATATVAGVKLQAGSNVEAQASGDSYIGAITVDSNDNGLGTFTVSAGSNLSVVSTSTKVSDLGGEAAPIYADVGADNAKLNTVQATGTLKAKNVYAVNTNVEQGTGTLVANSLITEKADIKGQVIVTETIDATVTAEGKSGSGVYTQDKTAVVKAEGLKADTATLAGQTTLSTMEATNATFDGGDHSIAQSLKVTEDLVVTNGATLSSAAESSALKIDAAQGMTINGNASVVANEITTSGNIFVGSDVAAEESAAGAGSLSVNTLNLNGKDLIVDPPFGGKFSFAGVGSFANNTAEVDAGVLNGNAYALQNSILAIGETNEATVAKLFAQYIDPETQSLSANDVGAIVYVAEQLDVASSNRLVVDPTATVDAGGNFDSSKYTSYDAYIGDHGVLAISVKAATTKDAAAIEFNKQNAQITASSSGKVVITGDYNTTDTFKLFDDNDNDGVTIAGANGLRVETLNGLMYKDYKNGDTIGELGIEQMSVDTKKVATAYTDTSSAVRNSIIAYVTGDTNWYNSTDPKHNINESRIHGARVDDVVTDGQGNYYWRNENGTQGDALTDEEKANLTFVEVKVEVADKEPSTKRVETQYLVYEKANNDFLNAIREQPETRGAAADAAAHMADFGGVAQVALKAGASTYEAISGRMGMGAAQGNLTFANNGQGAGIWVTPIYQSSDSDGFEAQGVSYGADISLYGVALGGDYTLANGVRVGALFNVGSGDADGQGAGSAVSSDFDYYGFGLYAGYSFGQFSVVGDVSYTVVDNDVEANTGIDKLKTSLDAANLSFGVTGAYAFESAAGISVTPHVGLRYSYLDLDDYTVEGSATGTVGSYDSDGLSVFSIPVGVTIASEFKTGSWSVKPSFDLTLTGNFGDDENEGTFKWAGVENIDSAITSEVFDNFTYGATLGIAAQSEAGIALGLTVGYTGSSNVDDLSVGANARFTF